MEWQGRTDGNRWMQQQLINCFRFLSLHIYYMGVAVVVPFYMLFGKGFKASYGFYRKRFGWSALKSFWWSYKNHYRFGQVMIDRFARYAGKTFTLTTENLELYNELEQGDDAFVMLSAHVGNYEMGGYTLVAKRKCIHMLVFAQETETVMENRQEQFGRTNIRMIPVGNGMNHLFAINEVLTTGQILSMTADRRFGSEKAVVCRFFGRCALPPWFVCHYCAARCADAGGAGGKNRHQALSCSGEAFAYARFAFATQGTYKAVGTGLRRRTGTRGEATSRTMV